MILSKLGDDTRLGGVADSSKAGKPSRERRW